MAAAAKADAYQLAVREHAAYLGFVGHASPVCETAALALAAEALAAPLPEAWRETRDDEGNIYFLNEATGEACWEHPLDGEYRARIAAVVAKFESFGREGSKLASHELAASPSSLQLRMAQERIGALETGLAAAHSPGASSSSKGHALTSPGKVELRAELERVRALLDTSRTQGRTERERAAAVHAEMVSECERAHAEADEARAELAVAQSRTEEIASELAAATALTERLEATVSSGRLSNQKLTVEAASLRNGVEAAESAAGKRVEQHVKQEAALSAQLRVTQDRVASLLADAERAEVATQVQAAAVAALEERLRASEVLASELQAARASITTALAELADERDAAAQSAAELEAGRQQRAQLETELQAQQAGRTREAADLERHRLEHQRLAVELEAQRAACGRAEAELLVLRADCSREAAELEALRADQERTANELVAQRAVCAKAETELQQQRNEAFLIEEQAAELGRTVGKLLSDLHAERARSATAEPSQAQAERVASLVAELEGERAARAGLTSELSGLKQAEGAARAAAAAEAEAGRRTEDVLVEAEQALQTSLAYVGSLQSEVADLEDSLAQLRSRCDAAEAARVTAAARLPALEAERALDALRDSAAQVQSSAGQEQLKLLKLTDELAEERRLRASEALDLKHALADGKALRTTAEERVAILERALVDEAALREHVANLDRALADEAARASEVEALLDEEREAHAAALDRLEAEMAAAREDAAAEIDALEEDLAAEIPGKDTEASLVLEKSLRAAAETRLEEAQRAATAALDCLALEKEDVVAERDRLRRQYDTLQAAREASVTDVVTVVASVPEGPSAVDIAVREKATSLAVALADAESLLHALSAESDARSRTAADDVAAANARYENDVAALKRQLAAAEVALQVQRASSASAAGNSEASEAAAEEVRSVRAALAAARAELRAAREGERVDLEAARQREESFAAQLRARAASDARIIADLRAQAEAAAPPAAAPPVARPADSNVAWLSEELQAANARIALLTGRLNGNGQDASRWTSAPMGAEASVPPSPVQRRGSVELLASPMASSPPQRTRAAAPADDGETCAAVASLAAQVSVLSHRLSGVVDARADASFGGWEAQVRRPVGAPVAKAPSVPPLSDATLRVLRELRLGVPVLRDEPKPYQPGAWARHFGVSLPTPAM